MSLLAALAKGFGAGTVNNAQVWFAEQQRLRQDYILQPQPLMLPQRQSGRITRTVLVQREVHMHMPHRVVGGEELRADPVEHARLRLVGLKAQSLVLNAKLHRTWTRDHVGQRQRSVNGIDVREPRCVSALRQRPVLQKRVCGITPGFLNSGRYDMGTTIRSCFEFM